MNVSEWYAKREDRLGSWYADRDEEFDPDEDRWEFDERFVEDGQWHCYRRTRPGEDYCLFHAHESATGVDGEGEVEPGQVLRDIVNATTDERLWNEGVEGLWEVPRHPPERAAPFDRDEYKRREKQFVGASLGTVELSYEDLDGPDSYPIDLRLATVRSLDFSRSRIGHGLFLDGLRQTGAPEDLDGDEYGIDLMKSRVAGSFRMRDARCSARVRLNEFEASVTSLNRAEVGGDVDADFVQAATVYLSNLDVEGDLSLLAANTTESLRLKRVDVDGDLSLKRADVDNKVFLNGATVAGSLDAADLETGRSLWLESVEVGGEVSVARSSIGNSVVLEDATAEGVSLNYASVAGSIDLTGATVETEADGTNADVELRQTDLSRDLVVDRADIEGSLSVKNADIDGATSGRSVTVGGAVKFNSSRIAKVVYLRGSGNSYGEIGFNDTDLSSAVVGGHVDGDARFTGLSAPEGFGIADVTVEGDVAFSYVSVGMGLELSHLDVGGDLTASWTEISGGFHAQLSDVGVDGSVRFTDCTLDGNHQFYGVETGGSLAVVDTEVEGELRFGPGTEIGGPLRLRGTVVSDLVANCTLTHPAVSVVSLESATIESATLAVDHGGDGPQPVYDLEGATVGDVDLPVAESTDSTKAFERLRFLGTTFDGFVFSERREQFRETDWQAHRPRDGGYEDIAVVTQSVEGADDGVVFETARAIVEAGARDAVTDAVASGDGDGAESDCEYLSGVTADGTSMVTAYLDGEFAPAEPANSPGGDPFSSLAALFEFSPDPQHDRSREQRAVAEDRLTDLREHVEETLAVERIRRAAALPYSATDRVERLVDALDEALRDPTAGEEPAPTGSFPSHVDTGTDGPLTVDRLGNAILWTLALSPSAVNEIAVSAREPGEDWPAISVTDGGVADPVATLCEAWGVATGPAATGFDAAVCDALADAADPISDLAVALRDDHERLVDLGLVSPEVPEDGADTEGTHSYGALADAIVDREAVSEAESVAEELAREEPRYRWVCDRLGVSLDDVEEAVARDLADHRTAMGTNNELESTYALAKNGASEAGDETAAGNFFQREAGYARRQHWHRLGGVGGVSKVFVALAAAAGALAYGLPNLNRVLSGTIPALSPVAVTSAAFALGCLFLVREELGGALKWLGNVFLWLTMGYGEKPTRVLGFAAAIVGAFALAYRMLDAGVRPVAGSSELGHLVFSLDMFVTLALDNPTAGDSLVRLLAVFEGFLGVFVIGMFVVAVTRAVHR
jgi:hypothetical protein